MTERLSLISTPSGLLEREDRFKIDPNDDSNQKARTEKEALASYLIGNSKAIESLRHQIRQCAENDFTVLILGESGTGKELVAQAIHRESRRANRPLISINCGAIPADLIESELFGHTKGAFTGATQTQTGRFETADHSSLFLDEIGDLPLSLQVKLLRVLQEREIEPLGALHSRKIDVRIIAATHQDLKHEMDQGRFRQDLYYRLAVLPIEVPPLRERKEDLPLLVEHFLKKVKGIGFEQKIEWNRSLNGLLFAYDWPGNIRELENWVTRWVVFQERAEDELKTFFKKERESSVQDQDFLFPKEGLNLKNTVKHFEAKLISEALRLSSGNQNQAAKLLEINRTTLIEKLKRIKTVP